MGFTYQDGYQHGYDDAKSESCSKCIELRKRVIAHCKELIEFLESIDGATVEDLELDDLGYTTIEAGEKIKALKALRAYAEYGG